MLANICLILLIPRAENLRIDIEQALQIGPVMVPIPQRQQKTRAAPGAAGVALGVGEDQRQRLFHRFGDEFVLHENTIVIVLSHWQSPYQDGTTHLVMTPLEFLQKLAALVPRPRLNLIRYHGVLAPNAKLRSLVVPKAIDDEPGEVTSDEGFPLPKSKQYISWARLLKRVFNIDIETCPHCQGKLKIIAAIEDPPTIVKILKHLGLPARAPPRAPANYSSFFGNF
jgi:hypothetical protein